MQNVATDRVFAVYWPVRHLRWSQHPTRGRGRFVFPSRWRWLLLVLLQALWWRRQFRLLGEGQVQPVRLQLYWGSRASERLRDTVDAYAGINQQPQATDIFLSPWPLLSGHLFAGWEEQDQEGPPLAKRAGDHCPMRIAHRVARRYLINAKKSSNKR